MQLCHKSYWNFFCCSLEMMQRSFGYLVPERSLTSGRIRYQHDSFRQHYYANSSAPTFNPNSTRLERNKQLNKIGRQVNVVAGLMLLESSFLIKMCLISYVIRRSIILITIIIYLFFPPKFISIQSIRETLAWQKFTWIILTEF